MVLTTGPTVARGSAPDGEPASKPAAPASPSGDAAAGKQLYLSYCSSCHGKSGDGKGPAAIALRPPPGDLRVTASDREALTAIITNGGAAVGKSPVMIAWKATLNAKQIADIVAFIESLKTK